MTQKTAYIVGNTNFIHDRSGIAKDQIQQFTHAGEVLSEAGYKVVNPNLNIAEREKVPFTDRMKNKIKAMMYCDVVYVLAGWEKCGEAKTEVELALNIKMHVIDFETQKAFRTKHMILTEINGVVLNVRI